MTHDHTLRFRSSFTKGLPFALLLAANLAPWACTSREDGGLGPGGSPDVHDVGVSFDGGAEPDDLGAADAGRWPDAEAAVADEGIAEGRSTTLVLRDGEGGAFAGAVVLVHGDNGLAEFTSQGSGRVVISDLARPTDVTVIWSPSVLTSLLGVEPGEEVVLDSELDATEASFGRLTVHATYPGATSIFVRACRSLVGPPANDPNPSNPADPFTVEVAACPLSGASGRAFVLAMAMGQALAVLPIDYTIVGGVARIDVGPDAPWILVGVAPIQIDPGLRFGTDYYADGYLCTPGRDTAFTFPVPMSPLGDAFELLYGRSDIDESTQHYRYRAVRRRWTLDGTSPAPPPQLEARAADLLAAVRSYAVTGTVAAPVIELTVEPGAQTGTVAYANFGLLDWTSWRVIGSPRWEGGVGRLRLPAVPLSRYGIHEGPWKPRWVWMVGGPGATYRAIRRRPMAVVGAFNDFVPFPEGAVPGPAGSVQLLYSNYGVPTAEW